MAGALIGAAVWAAGMATLVRARAARVHPLCVIELGLFMAAGALIGALVS